MTDEERSDAADDAAASGPPPAGSTYPGRPSGAASAVAAAGEPTPDAASGAQRRWTGSSMAADILHRYLWVSPALCLAIVALVGQRWGPGGALLSGLVLLATLILAASLEARHLSMLAAEAAIAAITLIIVAALQHPSYLKRAPEATASGSQQKASWAWAQSITFTLVPGSQAAAAVPAGCEKRPLAGVLSSSLDSDRDGPFTVYVYLPKECVGRLSVGEGEAHLR